MINIEIELAVPHPTLLWQGLLVWIQCWDLPRAICEPSDECKLWHLIVPALLSMIIKVTVAC